MIEKLKKETVEQVEINTFNIERQTEIQEVDERLSSLEGDDFLKSALSILDSALEKLEQILNEDIIIADQETANLDETITEELNKSTRLLNVAENLDSTIIDIDKSELTEKAQEHISELEELHEELTGESFTASVDSAIKSVLDASVKTDHLPSEKRGSWVTGTRGNGKFV